MIRDPAIAKATTRTMKIRMLAMVSMLMHQEIEDGNRDGRKDKSRDQTVLANGIAEDHEEEYEDCFEYEHCVLLKEKGRDCSRPGLGC